ncbi:TlpA family protein disulfide reductase [Paenibacillus planticolens]|uniref:Redoxin domain-containing protein n=1 Tax=Paenibacillus planticolens TaxID=2654976 RepID=A0ABX1ZLR5_9BACL|nr:TlpA disulfide reductase family protein [Paenibacillus planticolens]NOV01029.1 redoxin domain-containing protein [Paenibacillus planticolens]
MKKMISVLVGILLLSCLPLYLHVAHKNTEPSPGEGQKLDVHKLESIVNLASSGDRPGANDVKAPSFTLKSLDGSYYTIGGKREKPVVIHFWASWCEACSVEVVQLRKLYAQYKNQVDFLGINVSTEEKPENIEKFVKQNNLTYPILLDEHKHAADLYELHALPTVFLIDKNGFVVDTFHMVDPLELNEKIGRLAGP